MARHGAILLLSGLFCTLAPDAVLAAQERAAGQSATHDPIDAHIAEAAERFGLSPAWIRAVMRVESAGDLAAVSPKGAIGLMQIMPATWDYLSARHGLGSDPFDPRANILAGAAYLRELHDRYGAPGFLAAYNAGPGRYEASLNGRPLPAETRAYVAALAPVIDGETPPDVVRLATADRQAWRSATLFVSRSTRPERVHDAFGGRLRTAAATPVTDEIETAAEQQRDGLFVTRPPAEIAP